MKRTFTPELDAEVTARLTDFARLFEDDFHRCEQAQWSEVYLRGLLQDGDRKSVEPLVQRVQQSTELKGRDPTQAIQNFVHQGAWDHERVLRRYRALMGKHFRDPNGIFVFDDTSFPKKGSHSVGVQRQYCGALGKTANCQVAVSLEYATSKVHYPLNVRLFLPESWTQDPKRLDKAKVPEEVRSFRSKTEIALELLDQVREEGVPGNIAVADAAYGNSGPFRKGLEDRGLSYIVGINDSTVVFQEEPRWEEPKKPTVGRPQKGAKLQEDNPRPISLKELGSSIRRRKCTWREGVNGKLSGYFAWQRVWLAHGWTSGECAGEPPVWLLVERDVDGKLKYAISNLPPSTSMRTGVRLWKSRWSVEQAYQQLKEELGLDHYEGRNWKGFHHHVCLAFLAYGFLLLETMRAKKTVARRREKNSSSKAHHPSHQASPAANTRTKSKTGLPLLQKSGRLPASKLTE